LSPLEPVQIFAGTLNGQHEMGLLWNNDERSGDAATLTEAESARVAALLTPQAQQRRRGELTARRTHLADFLNLAPAQLAIDHHLEGQPFLPDFPMLSLSTSHSEGWSALALAEGRAIGLDIERIRPLDWQPMLSMICSEAERAAFLAAQPKLPAFFRLWTIKEAVLKATGQGFRAGPKAVQIPIEHLRPTPAQFDLQAHGVSYQIETACHDEIILALAITRDRPPPRTSA